MNLHEQKLRFLNQAINECVRVHEDWKRCQLAMGLWKNLEVQDLTPELCKEILATLPDRCVGNVAHVSPIFE